MWTKNFQMFKLDLEKAEEPEVKLQTTTGKTKGIQKNINICLCLIDYAKAFDCVDHNKLWKILQETGIPTILLVSWETCMQIKSNS